MKSDEISIYIFSMKSTFQIRTSWSLSRCRLCRAPGPDQQVASRISSQDISGAQEDQTLNELCLIAVLTREQQHFRLKPGPDRDQS